jgi:REP element-mobilizing transposase RayT
MDFERQRDRLRMLAFCIMPDHWHGLYVLLPGSELSALMANMSCITARRINRVIGHQGSLWQEGFHDHRCRNMNEIEDLLFYIENNPVRAGLVERPELWPFSSAHIDMHRYLDRQWWASIQ